MNESIQEYRTLLSGNPARAEKQLYKLAKKGDLQALKALNEYYEKCVAEAKTPKEASKIRQKTLKAALLSAKHNSSYWLIWVGEMYRYGVGTDKDERKAFSYYEKAATLGDVDGIVKVGRAYLNGIGVLIDYQKSMQFFEMAAERNNPEAMVLLAYQYENGKGADINYERASEWLSRAQQICHLWLKQDLSEADRNYYESLLKDVDDKRKHCESASCVEQIRNGSCPIEQRQKAFSRLSELAHQGNDSRSQVSMGILYEEGTFVAQDDKKALRKTMAKRLHGIKRRRICRAMPRWNVLLGCVISMAMERPLTMRKRVTTMACLQNREKLSHSIGSGFCMSRDLAWRRMSA